MVFQASKISQSANLARFSSINSAKRQSIFARFAGTIFTHLGLEKAWLAAETAEFTSFSSPAGICAKTSSFAGFMQSIRLSEHDDVQFPLMKCWTGGKESVEVKIIRRKGSSWGT